MEENLGSKPPHSTPKPSQQAVSSLHNNTHFVQVNRDSDGREYQGYTDGVTQPDLMSIGSDGYCPSRLTEQASTLPWRITPTLRLAEKRKRRGDSRAGQAMRMGNFHASSHLPALQAPQSLFHHGRRSQSARQPLLTLKLVLRSHSGSRGASP